MPKFHEVGRHMYTNVQKFTQTRNNEMYCLVHV